MKELLLELATGDKIYRQNDTVIVEFANKRTVLSTSYLNGGLNYNLQAVLNHHSGDKCTCLSISDYLNKMRILAESLGYNSDLVATMGTGVPMKNVVIKTLSYDKFIVTAIVTAGAEGNAGRAGDLAQHIPITNSQIKTNGTINIILHMNAAMNDSVLTRAIVMATEAKTAALQELLLGSRYSSGLATGTGTDQFIAISNPLADFSITDAGKHSKTGELIGKAVKDAVKEALYLHNGFDKQEMHKVIRRLGRFGISFENLYKQYCHTYDDIPNCEAFKIIMNKLDNQGFLIATTSLLAHLLDQLSWNLLDVNDVTATGHSLLLTLCQKYELTINISPETELLENWQKIYLAIFHKEFVR